MMPASTQHRALAKRLPEDSAGRQPPPKRFGSDLELCETTELYSSLLEIIVKLRTGS